MGCGGSVRGDEKLQRNKIGKGRKDEKIIM